MTSIDDIPADGRADLAAAALDEDHVWDTVVRALREDLPDGPPDPTSWASWPGWRWRQWSSTCSAPR